ncbi:MAG: GatB/YqeY domain-containing protein [Thermodesulfovibrionales bacterium]|nr:GatB/YqeY domain-containing protein [Thermodesulfovibrionales bacterium]
MPLLERIDSDLKAAMKASDAPGVSVLRLINERVKDLILRTEAA